MTEPAPEYGTALLLLGGVALLSVPLRAGLGRLALPGLVAFVAVGLALSAADSAHGLLSPFVSEQIDFLARLGLVALLFRVGLESDLGRLAGQLRRAAAIWLPNMVVPAALAFALVWAWPGLGPVPALLTGIAASATSIGVSVAPWEEAGALDIDDGALMLDVAELDDLSAVVLLGVVFAVAPGLQEGGGIAAEALRAGAAQTGKIAAFAAACYAFSRLAERRLTALFTGLDRRTGPFVFAAGAVFLIAAAADALGFSMAIGALFAGFAFSSDPEERPIDEAFAPVLALFGPFFFLSIGLSVETADIAGSAGLAAALFAVLVLGKLAGAGLPAWALAGGRTGLRIGASMIPRAEIFLVVMVHGLGLGPWAVSPELYTAAVLAALASCLLGPLLVGRLLADAPAERPA